MNVLLVSCYEMGHQPFAVASAAAHILARGHHVECLDLAVESFDEAKVVRADFVGISVPMHTAIRLGVKVGSRVRVTNPSSHICYFGLYASLNQEYLLRTTADSVIGGEFETPLSRFVDRLATCNGPDPSVPGVTRVGCHDPPNLGRQQFRPPARHLLPPLERYAHLETGNGELKLVGYIEASRGCAHRCKHCPIPVVYEGRLRILQKEVVLEDIGNLVSMGAQHINFGDPDFLNAIKHSLRIVRQMHARFPELSFDFTAKIEHFLEHEDVVLEMGELGCLFILSAVESVDDETLRYIDKGHTRADVVRALEISRQAGITLRPSLLPFTPWTTLRTYLDLLDFVEEHELVYHIDPVQYSIRLLLPPGSWLLEIPEIESFVGELVEEDFAFKWEHPDPRVDRLQRDVARTVEDGVRAGEDPAITFYRIKDLTLKAMLARNRIRPLQTQTIARPVQKPPKLTEDWFC